MPERGNKLYRFIDRYIGIPLLLAVHVLFRRNIYGSMALELSSPRIGILCLGAMGDLILASAAIAGLRARYPSAYICLFTSQSNNQTASLISCIDSVSAIRFNRLIEGIAEIRKADFDIFVDFGQWARISALISAVSGARKLVGFRTKNQFRHYCYDYTIDHSNDRHEVDNFRSLVSTLGIDSPKAPLLGKVSKEKSDQAEILAEKLSPFVIFHPWPSGYLSKLREWPEGHWAELATQLSCKGYRIVLTGSAADVARSRGLASRLSQVAEIYDSTGHYSVEMLAAVLSKAACVIVVNTGVLHLACAVNARTIAINGPTNPSRWGGLGQDTINLSPSTPPHSYLNLGFEYPSNVIDTLPSLSPNAVLAALYKLTHA